MTDVRTDWDAPIPATWILVGVLVVVHIASGAAAWSTHHANAWFSWIGERPERVRILAGGQFHPVIAAQPWRLLTSGMLHVSALHLLINGVALVTLGRLAEPLVGAIRMLATFFLGVAGGSLASHAATLVQSDGASAGAFAILAALVHFGYRHRDQLDDEDARLLGPILGGLLAANLVLGLLIPPLDAIGHLGGAIVGAGLGGLWVVGKAERGWWVVVAASIVILLGGWTSVAIAVAR